MKFIHWSFVVVVMDIEADEIFHTVPIIYTIVCSDLRLDPSIHGFDDRIVRRSSGSRHRTYDDRMEESLVKACGSVYGALVCMEVDGL